jgi:hypothetical protein
MRLIYRNISPNDADESIEVDITDLTEAQRADVLAVMKGQLAIEDASLPNSIRVKPVNGKIFYHECLHDEGKPCPPEVEV